MNQERNNSDSTKNKVNKMNKTTKIILASLMACVSVSLADVSVNFPVTDTVLRNLATLTLDFSVDDSGNVTLDATTSNGGALPLAVVNAWDGPVGTLTNTPLFNTSFSLVGLGAGGNIATFGANGQGMGVGNHLISGAGAEALNWTFNGTGNLNFKSFSYTNRVAHGDSNLRLVDSDTGTTYILPNTSTGGTIDLTTAGYSITNGEALSFTTDVAKNAVAGASLYGFSFDFEVASETNAPLQVATVIDTDFSPAAHTSMNLSINSDTNHFRNWSDSTPAYNLESSKSLVIYAGVDITADSGVTGSGGVIGIYTTPFNSMFARPGSTASNSQTQVIYLWDSNDFLTPGVIVFDDTVNSVLSVTSGSFTGDSGGMRFVIRDGSTYYVANQTTLNVGQSTMTATLEGDTFGLQWAQFDPANFNLFADDDANLGFGSVSFSSTTFSNVTGVGLIANAISSANAQIVLSDFQATLTNGGEGSPVLEPELFELFTDNMVLQRNKNVAIYGTGALGDELTVTFGGQTNALTIGTNGTWTTELFPMAASFTPRTLTVSNGSVSSSITNVLVGDVWFASGQSNMDHPFNTFSQLSTAGKGNSNIRLLIGAKVAKVDPQETPVLDSVLGSMWQECTPAYLEYFSTAAYFFGAKLQAELNVPIGLVESARGATIAEAWTPLDKMLELGYDDEPITYTDGLPDWGNQAVLYNGMVHPFRNFTFKGFIWYQGESNSPRAVAYEALFSGMIDAWRTAFGQGDLPFYFVQLAPYKTLDWNVQGAAWAWLRQSQAAALSLTNTGMAVTTDLGEYEDIHPQNKQPVSERLALHALKAEGADIVASSPLYSGMVVGNGQIIVSFANADMGLQTQQVVMNSNANYAVGTDPDAFVVLSNTVAGFQICGADEQFVDAQASINSSEVIVWADSVPDPVAVRYGWANFPLCNLFSAEGLPAAPFRTDSFEAPSFTGAFRGDLYSGDTNDLGEATVFNAGSGESVIVATNIASIAGYYISAASGKTTRYGYYKTINPDLKNGQTPEIAVEILYFDAGSGEFSFVYDSSDQTFQSASNPLGVWKPAGKSVALTGSGTWRVATVVLDDAWFANRCNGYDLRVQSTETDLILGGVYLKPMPGGTAYIDWAATRGVVQGQDGDDDLDGMSNYGEFIAGTNPRSDTSVLKIEQFGSAFGPDFLIQWQSVSGKTYQVSESTNLRTGVWSTISSNIPATAPLNSTTAQWGNAQSGYFRIEVE